MLELLLGKVGMIGAAVVTLLMAYFGIKRSGAQAEKAKQAQRDLKEQGEINDKIAEINSTDGTTPTGDQLRDSKNNRNRKG